MSDTDKNLNDGLDRSVFSQDGAYMNMVTGLGSWNMDKDEHVRVNTAVMRPNYDVLGAQYMKDGIVKRLAKDTAVNALKSPIVINGDKDDRMLKELTKKGFFNAMRKAGTWARLYGGALVVTVYEGDGDNDLHRPAPAQDKIVGYRVYSPSRVLISEGDFSTDERSDFFGQIETFHIQKRNGVIVDIHASRCTVVKGNEVADEFDSDLYLYVFGASEIEAANVGLKKLPGAFGSLSNMLQENGLSVFSLNGLSAMLADPDNGMRRVRDRMTVMKLGMSSMRAVIQDKDDTFEMKSHSMSEVPESVKIIMAYASALTGVPVSILFGNMVSGLSSTNEGDIRQDNDRIEQWRMDRLYEPMCRMITEFAHRNCGVQGDVDFQFGEVYPLTGKEKAEIRKDNADYAKTLYDMGAITPKEVRQNLLVNGGTPEISVKSENVPAGSNAQAGGEPQPQ